MRIAIPIFSIFLFLQFTVVAQCKISQNKFPDGTMYLETEPSFSIIL